MASEPDAVDRLIHAVDRLIVARRAVRAFTPDPVPRETVEEILDVAAWAPSGANVQPWTVHVLAGASLRRVCDAILAADATPSATETHQDAYAYYPPEWFEPFKSRRRELGWGLYGLLGITRDDRSAMRAQHRRNYVFFDAPVGLIFTIDRRLSLGSWLDYGMFLQNIMIAAGARGLSTCPQAAFIRYHRVLRAELELAAEETLVCGMALGYADPNAVENKLTPRRQRASGFTRFH